MTTTTLLITATRRRSRGLVSSSSSLLLQSITPCSFSPSPGSSTGGSPLLLALQRRHASSSSQREHRVERIVPFTCEQLFDVVADVDKYKFFLPYCRDSKVLRRVPPNFMLAQLLVGFNSVLSERYTSRIRLDRPNAITIAALDSQIFTRLESAWQFRPHAPTPTQTHTHTEVDFRVRFEVANPMAQAAIDLVFQDLVQKEMEAFEKRCHVVYGSKTGGK